MPFPMIRSSKQSRALMAFSLFVGLASILAADVTPPKLGDWVPEAEVRDDEDVARSLAALIRQKPTVLIFYRGGWCPYCSRHLAAVAEAQSDLLALGFQIIALSPDRPGRLRARPTQQEIRYLLLSDSKAHAMRAFGIAFKVENDLVAKYKDDYGIDLEGDSGETHHLLPHPAVFVVDAKGTVRFAHVNPDYKNRLGPDEILAAAREALY